MSFSFGGGSSKSSMFGYDTSQSSNVSDSLSRGVSSSTQDIAFRDLFANLYGGASNVAGRLATQAGGLSDTAAMLFSGGTQFLSQLQGGPESDYLESRVSGENPLLSEQISQLGGDIGQFFQEQVLPGITGTAVAAGQLGGGRQGVAQGIASREALKQFQSGATQLRAGDIAARDAAAQALQANRIAAAGTGISALPTLYGISEAGFGAELAPYERLAGILGGPTTLTQASSEDIAQALSRAYSSSYGEQKSTSKSKSFSIGF